MFGLCNNDVFIAFLILDSDIRHAKKLVEYFNPTTQAYEIKHIQDEGGMHISFDSAILSVFFLVIPFLGVMTVCAVMMPDLSTNL